MTEPDAQSPRDDVDITADNPRDDDQEISTDDAAQRDDLTVEPSNS